MSSGCCFIGGPLDGEHRDTPRKPWLIDRDAGWAYQWIEGGWHYASRPCDCGAIVRFGLDCPLCGRDVQAVRPPEA